jgi:hypothetical protein
MLLLFPPAQLIMLATGDIYAKREEFIYTLAKPKLKIEVFAVV